MYEAFPKSALVRGRLGGPLMTVNGTAGAMVWCDWIEGDPPCRRNEPFAANSLELVGSEAEPG
jgi:uncharacterized protein YodC (DUF2158 family)